MTLRTPRPPTRPRLLATALVLALAAAGHAHADDLLCLQGGPARQIERALRFTPRAGIPLRDRVIGKHGATVDLKKSLGLCLPTSAGPGAPIDALEAYAAKLSRTRPAQPKPSIEIQRVANRFGTHTLVVKGLADVRVTTAALLDPPPAPASVPGAGADLACYTVGRPAGTRTFTAAAAPIEVASAIGTWQLEVQTPSRLCVAADVAGSEPDAPFSARAFACYRAKLARTKPPQGKPLPRRAATTNRFGTEQLSLAAFAELCVASDVANASTTPTPQRTATPTIVPPTPTPTVTPPPSFTLHIEPSETDVDIGLGAHFTAVAVFANGDTADVTERVLWRSSSAAGRAGNDAGDRGRIDALGPGAAAISVLDEATGVTSTMTGGDALLTVNWTLQRLELLPVAITRGTGESFRARATGHFAHGFTLAIEELVDYASSDPAVAAPTNAADPEEHSRIVAVAEGTATISATDPITGLTSTESGDDVTMTVVPPLERCTITESTIALAIGTYHQFTARGFYPGGFERNVTQQVEWTSDDPTVAEAPNAAGDRSRVLAVGVGATGIRATDTVTGVACENAAALTVGIPSGLVLQPPAPNDWRPLRAGRSWHAIAIARFPPPIEKQYVTEEVEFHTSDPTIVAAPNVPGDRGRLDAVGSGTAEIVAIDPVSNVRSQRIFLRSLAGLTRVSVGSLFGNPQASIVNVGGVYYPSATGLFGDGSARLEDEDVTFVTDNPAVLHVTEEPGYWRVQAIAPGFGTLTAIDELTGISSDAFGDSLRISVRGAVERVEIVPRQVTRRVGEAYPFAALLHYEGGVSEIAPYGVRFDSSDPSVAGPDPVFHLFGSMRAFGAGTATITATHEPSGVSSSAGDGDATMTVVGPLTRVRVQPEHVNRSIGRSHAFTAIGYDADGRSTNVTQDVVWSSTKIHVVSAPNTEGNRSRMTAVGMGTATIVATDPEGGVASSDSGEDATFVVDSYMLILRLQSERTVLTVGETIQLTALASLSKGDPANVTQEVEYVSSNPVVALAENAPGDRSRIRALKAGSAFISAYHPGTGLTTPAAARVQLVVVDP